jgi:hypothetical protein
MDKSCGHANRKDSGGDDETTGHGFPSSAERRDGHDTAVD